MGTDVIGTADSEYLGRSVALSANGNVLMATGNGVLRVYLLAGTDDWMLNEDLSDSLTIWGRVSVSLDGFTIVASDYTHNVGTGRAFVYRRVGAGWEQRGDPLVGEASGDYFGRSVALSSNGTIVVVGAYNGDYVSVYRDEEGASGNHTLVARIEGDSGSRFGRSVATSGDATRLIVGAYGANYCTGAAFAYSLFPEPALLQRMDGNEARDYFGSSVALSSNGEVLAVGANRADYVKVYAADDSSRRRYSQLADRLDGPADSYFGWALSLSADGTRLAVGAFGDDQNGYHSGRAFVYAVHPRRHQKIGEFGGDAPYDYFGESVSLSEDGTRLAVGAHESDVGGRNSGHVCVFESA